MKIEMLEAVLKVVADSPQPRILCGDFNTPQAETREGRIITWAERAKPNADPRLRFTIRRGEGRRWDEGERNIIQGGVAREMVDAFRHVHGYGRDEFSWFLTRKQLRIGRRFDHIFCSPDLRVVRCEYLHQVREQALSDHSAMEMDFEL